MASSARTIAEMADLIPDHIPADRVVDIDIFNIPRDGQDTQIAWRNLRHGHDLIWTPHYGGHWIAVGGDLVAWLYRDNTVFSSQYGSVPGGKVPIPMIPSQADGDLHKYSRAILEPAFKPAAIDRYQKKARELTIEIVEGFRARGACEFVSEYSLILPLVIFLTMVDLPLEDREELHHQAEIMVRASGETRQAAFQKVVAYLKKWFDRRRIEPGDDVLSRVAHSRMGDRASTEDEVLGMGVVLLVGGLDTVSSMMSYIMRFLATHPDHRRWIIENPKRISYAIEEMMRRFGVVTNMRTAINDIEIDGTLVRAGEFISTPTCVHGLDERKFPNPLEVDFTRPAEPTLTFGQGPHRCLGANLARIEIRILLEEWLVRIPDFELDESVPIRQQFGVVQTMTELPLRWTVAARP